MKKKLLSKIADRVLSGKTVAEAIAIRDEARDIYKAILHYLEETYQVENLVVDEDDIDMGVIRVSIQLPEQMRVSVYIDLVEEEIGITPFDGMNKATDFGKISNFNLTDFKLALAAVMEKVA